MYVARPIAKPEFKRLETSNPEAHAKAMAAMGKEWSNLRGKGVWDPTWVREWSEVARAARRAERKIHLARIFGLMVEKGSELPEGDERRKFKYRVVFQGNRVINQDWEAAIYSDGSAKPVTMETSKIADWYA